MRKLIFFLIVLVGFGVLNYPYLSSRYREEQQKQLAMELLEQQESEPSEPLELAQQYNEAVAAAGQVLDDAFAQAQEGSGQQEDEEILGFVEIPKIEQYLPIYEGTSPAILNKGVGRLTGSSLPVGGESTHAVLAGHSGLASQLIFTDLEQLELGDTFYLHSLGQTLAYRVDQILTVNPWETEELQVQEGRDLVTLITCVPYGVNTHRLLVRGERVDLPEEESITEAEENEAEPLSLQAELPSDSRMASQRRIFWISCAALGVLAVGMVTVTLIQHRKR